METRGKIAPFVVAALATVLAVCGCGTGGVSTNNGGGSGAGGSSAPPASGVVSIYPGSVSVAAAPEAQVQFGAFLPSQPGTTFTWSVKGGSSNGTIDPNTGLYTPPSSVPNPATVTITATDTTATNEIGTATITVVAAQGIVVSPGALAVPAGTSQTFTATANGNPVTPTWEVNGIAGGNVADGQITAAGIYSAPLTPPPGGSVTITAVSGADSGTAVATVVFSNNSLTGSYAFSYSGTDASSSSSTGSGGPPVLAVAGSFTANPATGAIGGIEDYNSGGSVTVAIGLPVSGTYQVNPDGSGSAILNNPATLSGTETWQFTLGAGISGGPSQHALLVRFDDTATGSGSIDRQSATALNSLSSISGNYVFSLSGIDASAFPLQFAGIFNTDGAGNIPINSAEEDINDGGIATQPNAPDLSLAGSYSLDTGNPGSGRGYITLSNSSSQYACTCQFAFYMVDRTHLKVVEIDRNALLSGDIYAAPNTARGAYSAASLNGSYAFTLGGADPNGNPYAQGGIFAANGSGGITGGVLDTNDNGSRVLDANIASSSYTADPNFGRISLPISSGGTTTNYAAYLSANGPIEIISLDPNFMDSGAGFLQTNTTTPQGAFALNLTGIVTSGASEEDVAGQITIPGNSAPTGNLATNNSGSFVAGVPLGQSSTIGSAGSNGRGAASLTTHLNTFPLVYYTVDGNTVLVLESDSSRTMTGTFSRQF